MGYTYSEIFEKCQEADMILVGIGEEFQYDWNLLLQNNRFQEIEKEIYENGEEEYRWIVPFLQKMALEEYPDEHLARAHESLKELLNDRNYFIISIGIDDCVYQYGLREDRIVTPCGGFRQMQCDYNCSSRIMSVDEVVYEKVKAYFRKEVELKELQEPLCEQCGEKKRFNQIGTAKYAEEGYLPQWEKYTKWLQGTVNKKVYVIELGVGMQFPTIVRWPFERVIYYNQKALLFRIHSSLYQLGEKIGDRGVSIKEKPVSFLANGFVK